LIVTVWDMVVSSASFAKTTKSISQVKDATPGADSSVMVSIQVAVKPVLRPENDEFIADGSTSS